MDTAQEALRGPTSKSLTDRPSGLNTPMSSDSPGQGRSRCSSEESSGRSSALPTRPGFRLPRRSWPVARIPARGVSAAGAGARGSRGLRGQRRRSRGQDRLVPARGEVPRVPQNQCPVTPQRLAGRVFMIVHREDALIIPQDITGAPQSVAKPPRLRLHLHPALRGRERAGVLPVLATAEMRKDEPVEIRWPANGRPPERDERWAPRRHCRQSHLRFPKQPDEVDEDRSLAAASDRCPVAVH